MERMGRKIHQLRQSTHWCCWCPIILCNHLKTGIIGWTLYKWVTLLSHEFYRKNILNQHHMSIMSHQELSWSCHYIRTQHWLNIISWPTNYHSLFPNHWILFFADIDWTLYHDHLILTNYFLTNQVYITQTLIYHYLMSTQFSPIIPW